MVDAHLVERVVGEAVDPGVARGWRAASVGPSSSSTSSATTTVVPAYHWWRPLLTCCSPYSAIRRWHSPERGGDRLGAAAGVVAVVGQAAELLDHDRAGDVAAVVPAHAVGHHEDGRRGEEGVLVDLADQPDVGGGPVVQLDLPHPSPRVGGRDGAAGQPGSVAGMSASIDAAGFRTLADQLRGWSDDRLSRLLRERPDLGTPAPHDSSQLASRAATRSSVVRALDQLTRLELSVLDALVVAGQTPSGGSSTSIVNAAPARPWPPRSSGCSTWPWCGRHPAGCAL